MKEEIQQAIMYLKNISLNEPKDIRVEETEENRIVLSYVESTHTYWQTDRIYKEFLMTQKIITSMKCFNPNHPTWE